MADDEEKTEEPTEYRIQKAKEEEGNVPKSAEVVGAAVLTFASLFLMFGSSYLFSSIKDMFNFVYNYIPTQIDASIYTFISLSLFYKLMGGLLPLFAIVLVFILISNWAQFGFVFTSMKFKLEKLDPINGFKQLFGAKKFFEALKIIFKIIIIFFVMVFLILYTKDKIISVMNESIETAIDQLILLAIIYILVALFIVIIFAVIDLYITRFFYFKSLRMSKQDIKDEYKNIDGNPEVKSRIRQLQREISKRSLRQDVADSDVVITNPTHYAIALKYDSRKSNAPIVKAKGVDKLALIIKKIARENDILVIENPPLARSLYNKIEVGKEIPQEFYKAIAEVFKEIYIINQLKAKGGNGNRYI